LLTRQEAKRRTTLGLPSLSITPTSTVTQPTPGNREPHGSNLTDTVPLSLPQPHPTESDPSETDSSSTTGNSPILSLQTLDITTQMDNLNTDKQPLAEVQTAKMKDCPVLTAGRITPLILQSWSLACKRYMKHADKKPTEIVSFVAEAMLEPRLVAWYQAGQARIDALTLDQYLEELSKLVLEKNWAHKIRDTIISSKQGSRAFIDWKIELENLNAILVTSSPTHALTEDGLKVQLEANLNSELKINLLNKPTLSAKLDAWSTEVKERDDRVKAENARTQRLIDASNAARAAKRGERKDLLSRLSDPPRNKVSNAGTSGDTTRRYLPKLQDKEKRLLNEHEGCTRCRKFYIGHRAKDCEMTTNNTWPDAESYIPLHLTLP
jgi:hypothetical protein